MPVFNVKGSVLLYMQHFLFYLCIGRGLHIFRRTFATRMYKNGARVKEIAAYIGDLESITERYYIAVCKKIVEDGEMKQENENKQKNESLNTI